MCFVKLKLIFYNVLISPFYGTSQNIRIINVFLESLKKKKNK